MASELISQSPAVPVRTEPVGNTVVPGNLIAHEGNSLPPCAFEQARREVLFFRRWSREDRQQGIVVVSIDLDDFPAEGAPFVSKGLQRSGVLGARACCKLLRSTIA
jgi:hypothetical protein